MLALLRTLVNTALAGENLLQLGVVSAVKSTVLSANANIATQTVALVETLCSDFPAAVDAFADADFSECVYILRFLRLTRCCALY